MRTRVEPNYDKAIRDVKNEELFSLMAKELNLTEHEISYEVNYTAILNDRDNRVYVSAHRFDEHIRFVEPGIYSIVCYLQDDGSEPYWVYNLTCQCNNSECVSDCRKLMFYESGFYAMVEFINLHVK